MVTHTHSPLFVLSLVALLSSGCVAPAQVGVGDTPSSELAVSAVAFHQPPDQATLHVAISTFGVTCADPGAGANNPGGACPVGWTVSFALPSASQTPGVYSLSDPAFQSFAFISLGGDGTGCMGGGGGAIEGTQVEVLSVDASTIKVRLSGFDADADLPPVDGDYDAPVCP